MTDDTLSLNINQQKDFFLIHATAQTSHNSHMAFADSAPEGTWARIRG